MMEPGYPLSYLVRVPDSIPIAGLDLNRWLLITPAQTGNPLEAEAITSSVAGDRFVDGIAIGRAHMPDVREDLYQIANAPENLGRLARALDHRAA